MELNDGTERKKEALLNGYRSMIADLCDGDKRETNAFTKHFASVIKISDARRWYGYITEMAPEAPRADEAYL